jgi:hypothetical protein
MKWQRWCVVLVSLGALAALTAYVARHTYWAQTVLPLPLRGEAARNPLYAAERFAAALGADVRATTVLELPPPGGIVFLSSWSWDINERRRATLEDWVERGGHLVVDASLVTGSNEFDEWSGIRSIELERANPARNEILRPSTPPPPCTMLVEDDLELEPDQPGRKLAVCGIERGSALTANRAPLWDLRDGNAVQAIRVRIGAGRLTAINAVPFRGRDLFEGQHAELFVAATQLRGGNPIVFLSEPAHEPLLGLVWEHGAPVVALLGLFVVVALWRGAVRFGPAAPATEAARRSLAEQVRGTGRFAVRFGGGAALHSAAARALAEAAARRIPSYARLPRAERAAALAHAVGRAESAPLLEALEWAPARRAADLHGALALLEDTRRRILSKQRK